MESVKKSYKRIGGVLKPRQFDANSGILIPTATAYSDTTRSLPIFDHTDVDTIWDRIEPTNGKDVGRWERITNKTKVHELLIQWQCKHFTQSNKTPFVSQQWAELLMQEDIQRQIIEDSFETPLDLPPQAQDFLKYLRRDTKVTKELSFGINFKSFCTYVAKAKERMTCSPSGRTYSHYKVLLRHNRKILNDIFDIMDIAVSKSIVLDRWKRVSTTLLLKDVGQP